MKKQEARDMIDHILGPFLKEKFGMVLLKKGSDHIYGVGKDDGQFAAPSVLFLLTGNEFRYDLTIVAGMSSLFVAKGLGLDMNGMKIFFLVQATDSLLLEKGQRYYFHFTEPSVLHAYLQEFKLTLSTKGATFFERYKKLKSIQQYLNSDPEGDLLYCGYSEIRPRIGLFLAKMFGQGNLEELLERYVSMLEKKEVQLIVMPDAMEKLRAFAHELGVG